ncbi:MAG TPA: NRDE family protein [Streptosporangiaceae bacterium]|jgi:hypothetical protein
MCTVVVSLEPAAPMPLLLVGIRDEFAARAWLPPARHWPGTPLIGGKDELAGGTWLAVDPEAYSVACVLNGRGTPAPAGTRRSRGELPLGTMGELAAYDPFHLLTASPSGITVLSWDGSESERHDLGPGTHLITNAGLDPDHPKVTYFGPRFAKERPSGERKATFGEAWEPWATLVEGDGLACADPRAIRARRQLPDGRIWGTTSVSFVALADGGMRYDFRAVSQLFS